MTEQKLQQNTKNNETDSIKKSMESMSDEEIIQENLKEILEKKSKEERKANGRLIAVIIASMIFFFAIYNLWIRKSGALAGVLIPAIIMVSYGGWVVILAKRDKQRRTIFQKHIEEVALKNKIELEERKKKQNLEKNTSKSTVEETTFHIENEIPLKDKHVTTAKKTELDSGGEHRKYRKHQKHRKADGIGTSHATKDLRAKRPSFRQKLFRQNATVTAIATINTPNDTILLLPPPTALPPSTLVQSKKKKKLQRLNALTTPQIVRMSSAP